MKKYDSYKDSGIEWLGEIPSDWDIIRVKDKIVKIGSGVTPKGGSEVYVDDGIPFLRSQNVYDDGLRIDDVSFIDEKTNTKMKNSQIEPNDILVNITGASIGRTCIVPSSLPKANINQHIIYMRFKTRYVNYVGAYFKTNSVKEYINLIQAGTSKEALNMGQTLNIPLLLPSPEEQTAIAQYLDTKTQAIDKKVALLEKKIGYYKALRKSIINETVTRGLDKNVELKDSGIDRIGQIPKHWEVKRFKDSFDIFTGNSISDKTGYENPFNAIPYIATKDINFDTGQVKFNNGIYILKSDKSFKKTKNNTSLICIEGANAGKKIGYTEIPVSFVNKLCAMKGKSYLSDNKYNFYYLNSIGFSEQFFSEITGLIGGVSINKIKEFKVLFPPKKEQTTIATYLDHKTQTIDKIIRNIQNQVTTLKELRKTLINDVVTGKIRVTSVSEKKKVTG